MGPKTERLTILRAATLETELGDHDFCLSRLHYTDTDPTSRERAATAGIESGTSSLGVARSTDENLVYGAHCLVINLTLSRQAEYLECLIPFAGLRILSQRVSTF